MSQWGKQSLILVFLTPHKNKKRMLNLLKRGEQLPWHSKSSSPACLTIILVRYLVVGFFSLIFVLWMFLSHLALHLGGYLGFKINGSIFSHDWQLSGLVFLGAELTNLMELQIKVNKILCVKQKIKCHCEWMKLFLLCPFTQFKNIHVIWPEWPVSDDLSAGSFPSCSAQGNLTHTSSLTISPHIRPTFKDHQGCHATESLSVFFCSSCRRIFQEAW